jgi:DNA-binding response OmpR family regulator
MNLDLEASSMAALVVDDNAQMGRLVAKILHRAGHNVIRAGSLVEAKSAVEFSKFDLVVSDVMLGAGTGVDLHRWILQTRPQLASSFVFMTGGIEEPGLHNYILESGSPLLLKPFPPSQLLEVVGGLLVGGSSV